MSPAPDERDRIRAAIGRILQETPLRSNGAWTIVALAEEAGVPRNALTQRHPTSRTISMRRSGRAVRRQTPRSVYAGRSSS